MKRIKVDGMRFINEDGNQVVMNGINFVCKDKEKGYLEPKIEELLNFYSKRGFNLVRLGIFWDAVEPKPGVYDDVYLDKVVRVVKVAEQCGIYILLDMHQDLFAAKYGDGAPDWATLDEGLEHPENCNIWYEAYLSSPAIMKAADNFWANKKASDGTGLLEHYASMWEYIAGKFKGSSNIVGLEPMNEPYMGSIAPQAFGTAIAKIRETNPAFDMANIEAVTLAERKVMEAILTEQFMKFDREILMPFYNRILKAIRKVSDLPLATGGNIYSSSFVQTGIKRTTDSNGNIDTQQIYAPHGYDSVVDMDIENYFDAFNQENVDHIFAQKRSSQEALQVPVIVGEWGAFPSGDFTNRLIEHMVGILEKNLWSSTYWEYRNGMENDANFNSLERGYPVSIAGNLLSYHYDFGKKSLTVKWQAKKNRKTVLYVPDLTDINLGNITISNKAEVNIEKVNDVLGGFVTVVACEDRLLDVTIG